MHNMVLNPREKGNGYAQKTGASGVSQSKIRGPGGKGLEMLHAGRSNSLTLLELRQFLSGELSRFVAGIFLLDLFE
jgi:hypothetical protein